MTNLMHNPAIALGIIAAIIASIIIVVFSPIRDIGNPMISEEVEVVRTFDNKCEVETNDTMNGIKVVDNCNFQRGDKIFVKYRAGVPFAELVSP